MTVFNLLLLSLVIVTVFDGLMYYKGFFFSFLFFSFLFFLPDFHFTAGIPAFCPHNVGLPPAMQFK